MITINYENASINMQNKIARIISNRITDEKTAFKLIIGKIKTIRIGKKKSTIEIDKFYPQDLEDVLIDISIFQEQLTQGIMCVDTFFIADNDTIEHVERWIKWTENKSETELSIFK